MLNNEKKFAAPKICSYCGTLYEGYFTGGYIVDDVFHCPSCYERPQKPFFVQHFPAYYEGFDCPVYTFTDSTDLLKHFKTDENNFFCYNRCNLMTQSKADQAPYWWVLGSINNYDITKLGLPKWDATIYNKKGSDENE